VGRNNGARQSDWWLTADRRAGWKTKTHLPSEKKELHMNKSLTRWNPMRELEDFQHRILSAFNPNSSRRSNGQEALIMAEWMPPVDISEDEKEYVITAELPEVRKEDVKVTVENGVLTITGERRFEKTEENKKWHRVERSYGTFARTFSLPDDIDPAKVNAEFKNGMLKIHVAKSEAARPKQIDVKVN
jgi:HSP20 family protein